MGGWRCMYIQRPEENAIDDQVFPPDTDFSSSSSTSLCYTEETEVGSFRTLLTPESQPSPALPLTCHTQNPTPEHIPEFRVLVDSCVQGPGEGGLWRSPSEVWSSGPPTS